MIATCNIIFLDIDGVCTSMVETPGSYKNHPIKEYGLSPSCMKNLKRLIIETGAKIIVSSNWRMHGTAPTVMDRGKKLYNPIAMLLDALGDIVVDMLPNTPIKHKAEALVKWFDANPEFDGNFVVIDDDLDEKIQDVMFYSINQHLVLTDMKYGLRAEDCAKAKKILTQR